MHDDTRAAYCHLIESGQVVGVSRIDDDGYPWIEFSMKSEDGETEFHWLMLNHDGIERVPSA
jgi:hypothetical protein